MRTGVPPAKVTVPLPRPDRVGLEDEGRPAGRGGRKGEDDGVGDASGRGEAQGAPRDVAYRSKNARLIATSVVRDVRANSSSSCVSAVRRPNRS